ncbi:MAG: 16S rRNA (cytosine(967)-C(5))-methyltransferase RsmB [Candidatus Acidiferrales bacterium]
MPVSVARRIAFDVLFRVESESAYASELLHSSLTPEVKPADAALATEITLGVLRWRRLLDFLLDRQLKKPVARLDLAVAIALRIGLYQLRFLEKIPASATVNESVELVKRARKSSAASLVNAVLRRVSASAKSPIESVAPPGISLAERLGTMQSHPTWMVERWLSRFGEPATTALLEANNRAPRVSFAIHGADRHDEIVHSLKSAGLMIEQGRLLKNAFSANGGSIARTEAFRSGKISIQDEASQAVPLLLGVGPGDRVLDLCAAPGGKTFALARAAGSNGLVVAGELHEHRLRSMQIQLTRLRMAEAGRAEDNPGLPGARSGELQNKAAAVDLVALDAAQPLPFAAYFDRVLVDAPCSGTGTLARHPEIRWRLKPEQLAEFHALQVKLVRSALALLAPGGRLVYSTCSMEAEENELAIAEVLAADTTIQLVPAEESAQILAPRLAPGIAAKALFDAEGFFRTSPAVHGTDGFFAAVLTRLR